MAATGDWRLTSHTYLWMLPIYGVAAVLFEPAYAATKRAGTPLVGPRVAVDRRDLRRRGGEGEAIRAVTGEVPWDYSRARGVKPVPTHWRGLVRPAYAPVWFAVGLGMERLHDLLGRIEIAPDSGVSQMARPSHASLGSSHTAVRRAEEPEHTLRAYHRATRDGRRRLRVRCAADAGRRPRLHARSNRRADLQRRAAWCRDELADLHRLDFGSWHGSSGELSTPAAILTLEQLVETLIAAGRPLELAIETKHPTRFGGRVEREVVALLERFGLNRSGGRDGVTARVMSFSPPAVATARRLAPRVATVQLMQRIPASRRNGSLWAGATIAGPSLAGLRAFPGFVDAAHGRSHEIHVWTVDDPQDVAYLAELGVDAVITNRPDVALNALGAH